MHDPMTVAFTIRYPWPARGVHIPRWDRKYRGPFITIWHVDPEDHSVRQGRRDDDSCGWFIPPTTREEREEIRKIGEREWSTIFAKRAATAEGKDYAYVCFEPTTYDAIYWTWWEIKRHCGGFGGRHFKRRRPFLSNKELQEIYELASNPVDNLQSRVTGVVDANSCGSFFLLVYGLYQRFNRPWYKHPRWHFWHWKIQVQPLQKLRRRLFDRCDACGKPFGWNESPIGTWHGDKLWHDKCQAGLVQHEKASASDGTKH